MHRSAATVPPEYLTRRYPFLRVTGNIPTARWIAAALIALDVAACSLNSVSKPAANDVLSEEDKQRASTAQIQALETGPSGTAVSWSNPESAHYGNIVPGPAYVTGGVTCRQFTDTRYVGGTPQTERGTSCRNPDGTWSATK